MTKDEALKQYIETNYKLLDKYIDEVIAGKVNAGKKEIQSVKRFLKFKEKYIYKEAEVKRVLKFFFLLRVDIANKIIPYPVLDFQLFWIANLYGLYKPNGKRLFRRCYITVGKKNAKTYFNACIALYELLYDAEKDAQIVLLASTREQATIALNFIKQILEYSTDLPELVINRNEIYYYIKKKVNGKLKKIKKGTIFVKSSDAAGIQGGGYSFSLIDEFSFHQNTSLANRAYTASIARYNPLQVLITTAGYDKDVAPSYQMQQMCINILDETVEDDSIFTCIYTLDDVEKEVHDFKAYRKSNPALGKTIDLEELQSFYKQAQNLPSFKQEFYTDNLNIWLDNKDVWLSDDVIKERMQHEKTIPENADVYIGFDGSATRDLSSICVLYYDEATDEFITENYFLFPNNPQNLLRKGNIDLNKWISEGLIIQTEHEAILDGDYIKVLEKLQEQYNILSVGIDPYYSSRFKIRVEKQLGLKVSIVPQHIKYLSEPLKEVEKTIVMKKLFLQQSPVMRWNFRNATLYRDNYSNNIKLNKINGEAIDGCVALNIAMFEYFAYNFDYRKHIEAKIFDGYLSN